MCEGKNLGVKNGKEPCMDISQVIEVVTFGILLYVGLIAVPTILDIKFDKKVHQ